MSQKTNTQLIEEAKSCGADLAGGALKGELQSADRLQEILETLKTREKTREDVLTMVFDRLKFLADKEFKEAEDLLANIKEYLPYARSDRDLSHIKDLMCKARHHQQMGGAYQWAEHDIRCKFGLVRSFAEHDAAIAKLPSMD